MIGKHLLKGSIVGAFAFGSIALSDQPDAHATTTIPYGQSLKLGRQTSQPIGHYDFCRAMPSECDSSFDTVPRAALTESLWRFIVTTDRTINSSIAPVSDEEQWGGRAEVWSYADQNIGDCEDYVLEKRRALMERIHEANLLITFVRKPNGEGHAVLTVRTDHGDLILDNLQDPMMLDKSRYTFL